MYCDLAEQVARIYAFNGGGAGLRAAEGEVMAARKARRQRPEAEHSGKILDPGQAVAEMPRVIRRDGVRVSVDYPVIARIGQAITGREQRCVGHCTSSPPQLRSPSEPDR